MACSIACLVIIDLIATRTLRDTLTLVEVITRDAAETCVCGTLACKAGLKTKFAFLTRWELERIYRALTQTLAIKEVRAGRT